MNVAIISSWHVHAGEYADGFVKNGANLTVMWDENENKGREFAEKYGMDFESNLDILLARTDVDAVCINAPTNKHGEIIVKCASAGKHVFTEKVLALTSAECENIRRAVEQNGVKLVISFPHRTFPRNLYAKQILDEGRLGKITYLRVRNAHSGASAGWLPPHFYDKTACGGGAMIDLGAHPMYLIAWFLGKPLALVSTFTHVTGKEVEDNAVTVMQYENGCIAVSETGFVSGYSPYILEIYGTNGSLLIRDNDIRLLSEKGPETPTLPEALQGVIPHFMDCVLHDKKPLFGLDDAELLTQLMEAAYKSFETHAFVKM